jgi:hypothetical protein
MPSSRSFDLPQHFGYYSGWRYIAYFAISASRELSSADYIFTRLRGLASWEIDSQHSAYLLLEPWLTAQRIKELYLALRHTYGPYIRFGAAGQKTTARAAALFRPVPHCTIVTPQNTDQFLSELPIKLLPGLGQRTTNFLEARGITTFNAFRQLPAQTLKTCFGVSGLILQQFARGFDPRAVEIRSAGALAG